MYNTIQYIYIFIQIERAGLKYLKYVHHTAALCYFCVFSSFLFILSSISCFSQVTEFTFQYTENNLMKRKKEQNIKITTYSLQYKKKWDTLSSIHTFTFFCSFSLFSSFLFFSFYFFFSFNMIPIIWIQMYYEQSLIY